MPEVTRRSKDRPLVDKRAYDLAEAWVHDAEYDGMDFHERLDATWSLAEALQQTLENWEP